MNKIFEQLLRKRGFDVDFLEPKYEALSSPFLLPDMKRAVQRLKQAKKDEKIIIFGDYDVDGVTATAIMLKTLELAGFSNVEAMLPDRFTDGYGMSQKLIERVKKNKTQLVITVDCGSNNDVIIEQLNALRTDVIVTDHHEISGQIPCAIAVINPKRPDFREKGQDVGGLENLSGAGVAFMLARALVQEEMIAEGQEKWLLDLAMIGIICDSMLLVGDNRIICKYGAIVLAKTQRPGLKELMKLANVKQINSTAIGFQIGPRLNAAGRMENANKALELLTSTSRVEAAKLAEDLNNLNIKRRNQQQQAIKEVDETISEEEPVIIVTGDWNEGIVGIIAGKLTEKYQKPSFVLAKNGADLKGSGRSFGEFSLAAALDQCRDILISGGGHAAACGLRLEAEKLTEFQCRINDYYRSLNLQDQTKYLDVMEDLEISDLSDLDFDLMADLAKLEPFGEGNKEPLFLLKEMFVLNVARMADEHLRLNLRDDFGNTIKALAFYAKDEWFEVTPGTRINVWVNLVENEWNGVKSVEGRIVKLSVAF